MDIQYLNPSSVFSVETFTQMVVVKTASIAYLSGQVALDKNRNVVGKDDFRAQTIHIFENIKAILASINADFTHIIKLTNYVVNYQPHYRDIYLDVLKRYLVVKKTPPANTLLGVQSLAMPELLIEIDVIAIVP